MTDKLSLRYAFALLAWGIWMVWPGLILKRMMCLLPSVGDYAYWDDPWVVEWRSKDANWRRDLPWK